MNTSFESTGSKRGRPFIPLRWTRVIRMKENGNTRYAIHDIGPDLLFVNALPLAPREERIGASSRTRKTNQKEEKEISHILA